MDDLIAFLHRHSVEDRERSAHYRAASRRMGVGHGVALLAAELDSHNERLQDAIYAYESGLDPDGQRLRQMAFDAYGRRDDYRRKWQPTVRAEDAVVSPPASGVNLRQVSGKPRDALAELDELRARVNRLERLLAEPVPVRP
jgi:hypothetical protein